MADEIDEQFSKMTVVVLKKKLASLKCSTAGNKAELCERLKKAVFNTEEEVANVEQNDDAESIYYEDLETESKSSFTFKDVDESFETFSGDDNKDVRKWLNDFEDMSKLMNWNDLQKKKFSRRLLKGSPKLFINSE